MKYYVFENGRKFTEDEMQDIFKFCRSALVDTLTWNGFISIMSGKCGMKEFDTDTFDSVIDFLKLDMVAKAVIRYKNIHDCGLETAKNMVYKIREDMDKFSKKGVM